MMNERRTKMYNDACKCEGNAVPAPAEPMKAIFSDLYDILTKSREMAGIIEGQLFGSNPSGNCGELNGISIDWYRPYGQTDEPIPFETLVSDLRDMKTADVSPVRHGEWLPTTKWWQGGSAWKQCSECGILHLGKSNFCPNCGAKMDGDKDA